MKIIHIFLFLLISLSGYAQDEKKDYSEAIQIIDLWLDAEKDYNNIPGLSVAIVHDQEVIWKNAYGYANVEEKVPSSTSTNYSICSISKLFTSIGIMQLRDAGKLSLEDHIQDLLPWYDLPQVHENSGPITVRSLLTHSSGLPRESNHPYWSWPDFEFPQETSIKNELKNQETLYPASTYFQYSNLGLTLLGEIISEVSGQSYEEYIKSNILQPIGLSRTHTYLDPNDWGKGLAKGYSAIKRDQSRSLIDLFDAEGITAAAGFSSTVEDLAKFAMWQFRTLGGENEILKSSTLKEMQRVHFMDPGWKTSWGLGFSVYEVSGNTLVGHGGSCPGYRSQIMLNPKKKLAIVVAFNGSGINTGKYIRGIAQMIGKASAGKVSADSLNLAQYAGWYQTQPWGSEMAIVPWQGKLAALYLPTNDVADAFFQMKWIEGDTFRRVRRNDELGEEIRFEKNANGEIVRMWQHNNYEKKLADIKRKVKYSSR